MRQLSFVQNNRPGDSRLPANRRAVRSWAARDPLGKSGQRMKRRRRRYKAAEVLYMDDRALEALQSNQSPSDSRQDRDSSESEPPSATSGHAPDSVFTPANLAPSPPLHPSHDQRQLTPPNCLNAPPQQSRNEVAFRAHTGPLLEADTSAQASPPGRPLDPTVADSISRLPSSEQTLPVAIPTQNTQDTTRGLPSPVAPLYTQWRGLVEEPRTQSLAAAIRLDTRTYTLPHPSLSPPSAVSEPSHRVVATSRTDLPAIASTSFPCTEVSENPSGCAPLHTPAEARVNSFSAFAQRHSNLSWFHYAQGGPRISDHAPKSAI